MKYGTQTKARYIYPFIKNTLDEGLSTLARKRLKWMLYIYDGHSVAQCSRHFDIPLRTIWYWYRRFNINKVQTLENKSRRPKNVRYCEVPTEDLERIIYLRKKYPSWGRKKIQKLLSKEGIYIGQTRIQTVINRKGLKRVKKHRKRKFNRKHMYTVPKETLGIPGGLIYVDVKHIQLAGGNKGYIFTGVDHSTRYLFTQTYSRITSNSGSKFIQHIQRSFEVSKICYIGSDNGSEFLGLFNEMLSELKINHVYSSSRSPKQNPFVERVIQTIITDHLSLNGTQINIAKQQDALDEYTEIYNKIRPHESLEMDTPYERYVKLTKFQTM